MNMMPNNKIVLEALRRRSAYSSPWRPKRPEWVDDQGRVHGSMKPCAEIIPSMAAPIDVLTVYDDEVLSG